MCADEQKEREDKGEKVGKANEREGGESRCKLYGEHLSRNIHESVAGNDTDAEKREGNGEQKAARLDFCSQTSLWNVWC